MWGVYLKEEEDEVWLWAGGEKEEEVRWWCT